jgi:hypothetical protein
MQQQHESTTVHRFQQARTRTRRMQTPRSVYNAKIYLNPGGNPENKDFAGTYPIRDYTTSGIA